MKLAHIFPWKTSGSRAATKPTIHLAVCLEEEVFCPVSYVRLVNHIQHASQLTATFFVLPRDFDAAREKLAHTSVLVFARCASKEAVTLAKQASQLGIPVAYDIDDYLWKLPSYVGSRDLGSGVDSLLSYCSLVTTPSLQLQKVLQDKFPKLRVEIIPNAGNLVVEHPAPRVCKAILANSDFFRLPQMRVDFFRAVRDGAALAKVRMCLFYLSNDPPEHFTDDPYLQIVWGGIRSYSSYRSLLTTVAPDLGIVPLPDDGFSQYKSVVKFAEFGAHGIPTIFSNVEPYRSYVRHDTDGWLCDNSYESWKEAVFHVLSQSPEAVVARGAAAKLRSGQEFDAEQIRSKLLSTLIEGLKASPVSSANDAQHAPPPLAAFTFRESYDYIIELANAHPARAQRS